MNICELEQHYRNIWTNYLCGHINKDERNTYLGSASGDFSLPNIEGVYQEKLVQLQKQEMHLRDKVVQLQGN